MYLWKSIFMIWIWKSNTIKILCEKKQNYNFINIKNWEKEKRKQNIELGFVGESTKNKHYNFKLSLLCHTWKTSNYPRYEIPYPSLCCQNKSTLSSEKHWNKWLSATFINMKRNSWFLCLRIVFLLMLFNANCTERNEKRWLNVWNTVIQKKKKNISKYFFSL